jgi:hypothetical protein
MIDPAPSGRLTGVAEPVPRPLLGIAWLITVSCVVRRALILD